MSTSTEILVAVSDAWAKLNIAQANIARMRTYRYMNRAMEDVLATSLHEEAKALTALTGLLGPSAANMERDATPAPVALTLYVAQPDTNVWLRAFGRSIRLTAIATTDAAANAHMHANPDASVIATFEGLVLMSDKNDGGVA